MIPATLTDADLTTILDGCYMERMELVARIRGKTRGPDRSGKEADSREEGGGQVNFLPPPPFIAAFGSARPFCWCCPILHECKSNFAMQFRDIKRGNCYADFAIVAEVPK